MIFDQICERDCGTAADPLLTMDEYGCATANRRINKVSGIIEVLGQIGKIGVMTEGQEGIDENRALTKGDMLGWMIRSCKEAPSEAQRGNIKSEHHMRRLQR